MKLLHHLLFILIAVGLFSSQVLAQASFHGIGGSGGYNSTYANGISADGHVVYGRGFSTWTGTGWACLWTEVGGYRILPSVPGFFYPNTGIYDLSVDGTVVVGRTYSNVFGGSSEACFWAVPEYDVQGLGHRDSNASGVSADGSIIVGGNPVHGAFLWTAATGLVGLGDSVSSASAISDDGTVIVGQVGQQAFRWTASTGMVGLGIVPGFTSSSASHVSADGSVVAGTCNPGTGGQEIFRWTGSTGLEGLGVLPGTYGSQINDMSSDGAVIVGRCNVFTEPSQAFRWTAVTGMVEIASPETAASHSYGVSDDGAIIVGYRHIGQGPQEAFVWDAAKGMRNLRDVLVNDFGLDLTGWHLRLATDISPDGQRIVGWGINPDGYDEGWVAYTPWSTLPPACAVFPDSLNFGVLALGDSSDATFTITNTGGGNLTGSVSESCDHYSITDGAGPFALATGETLYVDILFKPTIEGTHNCTINTGNTLCGNVECTGVGTPATGVGAEHPLVFALHQNHPNPFNPSTTISFTLPKKAKAILSIFNIEGKLVKTLVNKPHEAGFIQIIWDGTDSRGNAVASGIYFYRLKACSKVLTRQMVLIR